MAAAQHAGQRPPTPKRYGGHAFDLFVNVLGMSFNDAMRQIVPVDNASQITE